MQTALCGDDRAVPDVNVPGRADLSREDATIPNASRSREAHLAAQDRVLSDFAGVAHQNEIIDFRATADARFADGRAVDGLGDCCDFSVVRRAVCGQL